MRAWLVLIFIVFLQAGTVMWSSGAQARPGAAQTCPAGQQRVFRFRFVPLTEHFFIAGRRADGGAWSWGFNYPATWRVTTNPPNWAGWNPRFGSAELIVTPDRQGITHGYRLISRTQNGIISPESAISWYIQRFQDFRVRGRMDVPGAPIPGYQADTVTLFYRARYRGRPVEGILSTETASFYDPMLGGAATIVAFNELQLQADLPPAECYEKLNGLIGIALSSRNVREVGDLREAKRWIDTLGGLTEARNPTTGERFLVPFTYKYWWQDGTTLIGTNDPARQQGTLLELP